MNTEHRECLTEHRAISEYRDALARWKNGETPFKSVMYAGGKVLGMFYAGKIPREQLPAGEDFLLEDRQLADRVAEDLRECHEIGTPTPARQAFCLGYREGYYGFPYQV